MPLLSKVRKYKPEEVPRNRLAARAYEIWHKKPFSWQLDATQAILCGQDVVVDVGTGSGKTLCFSLPLVLDEDSIVLTISPLTALMINQAETAGIATVAVCKETLSRMGSDKLYADIAAGKFRQVIVSPEIVISSDFRTAVLSKDRFATALRAVCIDEAHCISLWGGSFRSDYASLGVLRGRFPKNVPFVVASATLPSHVLNDVRHKLQLGSEKKMVRLTNARPNVAVSVRTMKHSEETKGDIRFLIPPDAKKPGDIPITLVYCNQRTTTEDAADRARDWAIEQGIDPDCIAFYHAYVGEKRKRELESLLEKGEMRILFFTDAVGMGCDMRNIARVVLWGLPPSFCALVQRAGRAGRDLKKLGEGILIVSPSVMKDGVTAQEVSGTVAVSGQEAEATNLNEEDLMAEVQGMEEQVSPEGVRIAADESASEGEGDNAAAGAALSQKMKRKGKASTDTDVHEANALSKFVGTKSCRRVVWDSFFENSKKLQLIYPANTAYQPIMGTRCCDNCEPRLFPVEDVDVVKPPGLKRGKKKTIGKDQENVIREALMDWADNDLVEEYYGVGTTMSGRVLLGNDIIEKLATCGERLNTHAELRRQVHWAIGHDTMTGQATKWGILLLGALSSIYEKLGDLEEGKERERYNAALRLPFTNITPADFDGEQDQQREEYNARLQFPFTVITPADFE